MTDRLIKYIKYLIPGSFKRFYRKVRRKYERIFILSDDDRTPLTLMQFEKIIKEDMQINSGDTIIVHSSFGNMNADFSPQEAVDKLKEIIGTNGNILMPFYPTGHAFYWIQEGNVFDTETSKSVMGVLTQVFKESEGVKLSPHPVKAMAVWGKDKDDLISTHFESIYPYDEKSPYYKVLNLPGSKSLGLGVEINSFTHTCEDLFLKDKFEIYSPDIFTSTINYYGQQVVVNTYLHDPQKVNSIPTPCGFLKDTKCPNYTLVRVKGTIYYSVPNQDVYHHNKALLTKGISRTTIHNRR